MVLVEAEIKAKAAKEKKKARETEGQGEQAYLTAIAEGQKAQAEVLGEETTAKIQMFQMVVKAIQEMTDKNPEILTTALTQAKKFVPDVVVNNSGGSNDLSGAAAIFGRLMNGTPLSSTLPAPPPLEGLGIQNQN
jgi:hypothetical protein